MKTKNLPALLLFLLLAAFASGCTHVRPVAFTNPTLNAGAAPFPARVALVIKPEVSSFKHKYSMMGDTWEYPFGPSLEQYIRHVAGAAFAEVKEYPTTAAAANQADAVVVVDSPKAEHTMPVLAWQKRGFVLRVNWTVNDRAGQSPVWLKTMESQAEENAGNAFTGSSHEKILIQALMSQLSTNTYQALVGAGELKGISRGP